MSARGIDVSKWQGQIDWERVKNAGIEFAILRCGYGDDIPKQDDPQFIRNADECTRLGIPFGVYLYSYATNTAQAKSEVAHTLRLVSGYKLAYGIWYDMEDASQDGLSNDELASIAMTYCNAIEDAGYYCGIYANLNWMQNKLNDSRLDAYDRWVAQWADACTYDKAYGMWQQTSDGSVDGINGRVDMDIAYKDYPSIMANAGLCGFSGANQDTKNGIFQVGDAVKIIGEGNSQASGGGGKALGIGWEREILKIHEGAAYPYQVGNASGTTGFYAEDSLEKL